MKKIMAKRISIGILLGTITSFSIFIKGDIVSSDSIMQMLSEEIDGINLEALIVLCSLCFLFYKKQHVMLRKIEWIPFIIAIMFSGFTLIGISYSAIGNWDFVFGGKKQFLIAVMTGIGFFFLYYLFLLLLFIWIEKGKVLLESWEKKNNS